MKELNVHLLEMVKSLLREDTDGATAAVSQYFSKRSSLIINEVYNTADGPHNNWGMGDEFDDEFDGEDSDDWDDWDDDSDGMRASDPGNFDEYDVDAEIPRGDRSIDDLDASGELEDHISSGERQLLSFASAEEAQAAVDKLERYGIEATVRGKDTKPDNGTPMTAGMSPDNKNYVVSFIGDEDTKREIYDEMDDWN